MCEEKPSCERPGKLINQEGQVLIFDLSFTPFYYPPFAFCRGLLTLLTVE